MSFQELSELFKATTSDHTEPINWVELDKMINQVKAERTSEPYSFIMAPKMHKRFYMLNGLQYVSKHATSPMRKVHLRKIAARRKARKRQLERIYQHRYGVAHAS